MSARAARRWVFAVVVVGAARLSWWSGISPRACAAVDAREREGREGESAREREGEREERGV